jgi:hypothetical protein
MQHRFYQEICQGGAIICIQGSNSGMMISRITAGCYVRGRPNCESQTPRRILARGTCGVLARFACCIVQVNRPSATSLRLTTRRHSGLNDVEVLDSLVHHAGIRSRRTTPDERVRCLPSMSWIIDTSLGYTHQESPDRDKRRMFSYGIPAVSAIPTRH